MDGKLLRHLRLTRGMTQAEFAQAIGVGRGTLSGWERNCRKPSMINLYKIAQYLDVDPQDLMEDRA